jgi:seryl-tRNA synthetase
MWLSSFFMVRVLQVAGQRGFFLTGPGVLVNMALMQYGLDFLRKRGYQPTATPLFMNQSVMAKTAQLSDFDEQLYKVTGHGEDKVQKVFCDVFSSGEQISHSTSSQRLSSHCLQCESLSV